MTRGPIIFLIAVLGGMFWLAPGRGMAVEQTEEPLIIFAASSLAPALDEIARTFEDETGRTVRVAYGSSAVLARQIANGAPVSLYIGAHPVWIRFLVDQGLASPGNIHAIAQNALVIAAPAGTVGTERGQAKIAAILLANPSTRIAVGNTDSVPLGLYIKEALQTLGLWQDLLPRLAPAANARRTLAFVASGSVDLGIVFASDAASDDRVQILATVPTELHSPIRYMAVPLKSDASGFIAFLTNDAGRRVLTAHGFQPQ